MTYGVGKKGRLNLPPYQDYNQIMNLTIKYPLKLKLLLLLAFMMVISLAVFVTFAVQIFRADKSAYIYEALLSKANTEKIIFENQIRLSSSSLEVKDNKLFLNKEQLRKDNLGFEEGIIQTDLIFPKDNKFYLLGEELQEVQNEKSVVLQDIFTKNIFETVREITLDDKKYLFSFSYQPEFNFIISTLIPYDVAFNATDELIEQSLFFGTFILGLCLILSVFLVRPLTRQLEELFVHTQKIAAGDFKSRIPVRGSDEVSALTSSVNNMSQQIGHYIEEMKEKARLENEVAVAQLVQSSFFPEPSYQDNKLSFFAHYLPASECGGDWWGVFHTPTHKIFFIADATGHGVPAALLTATMNCCKTSLNFLLESRPELIDAPEEILRYMNQAVLGAGKEIQVTCFVAILELDTNKLTYANASHPVPLLFNSSVQVLEKSDIIPLQGPNGPRLGERESAVYEKQSMQLKAHDTIILYTDGILEATNVEDKRWGERRFIKVITENHKLDSQQLLTTVMCTLEDFMKDSKQDDDFTLLSFKVLS